MVLGVVLYPKLKLMSRFPRRSNQEVSGRVGSGVATKNAFAVVHKSLLAQFRPQTHGLIEESREHCDL